MPLFRHQVTRFSSNALLYYRNVVGDSYLPALAIATSLRVNRSLMTFREVRCRHHHAAVAFGSNLGNRIGYIEAALIEMGQAGINVLKTSPIYETKPMYYEDQDTFLNGVCYVQTDLEPLPLLDTLQSIELRLKRNKEIEKGPRTIDLDVVLYNDAIVQHERLQIPHKLLHEREFVLRPLDDILAEASVVQQSGKRSVRQLYSSLEHRDETMSPVTELSPCLPLLRAADPTRPTHIMAILNLTPDSFSDGGFHDASDMKAIQAQVSSFVESGATIVDVGGQSTRPKAELLTASAELDRILPAIRAIRSMPESRRIAISVDTFYSEVAREAVAAGADIINDISAGVLDPMMLPIMAQLGKTVVLMHMRGDPHTMTKLTQYPNGVVHDVANELSERVNAAEAAGIPRWRIILDPGIGFAKNQKQNLELLRRLPELRAAPMHPNLQGLPWLVGTSRKGFIGKITGVQEADKRLMGTAAAITASIAGGADIVRVHDVEEMTQLGKMADAIYRNSD